MSDRADTTESHEEDTYLTLLHMRAIGGKGWEVEEEFKMSKEEWAAMMDLTMIGRWGKGTSFVGMGAVAVNLARHDSGGTEDADPFWLLSNDKAKIWASCLESIFSEIPDEITPNIEAEADPLLYWSGDAAKKHLEKFCEFLRRGHLFVAFNASKQ